MSETVMIDAQFSLSSSESAELGRYEAVIRRGLETFFDVGRALLTIRDDKLYRAAYGTFEEYCRERWGFTDRRARMLIDAAATIDNLKSGTIVPLLPVTESQARPLTKLEPDQQREAWAKAVDTAPNGKVTAAHVQSVVDEYEKQAEQLSEDEDGYDWTEDAPAVAIVTKPHVTNNSGNNEWYTPIDFIEAARLTLGAIELDPATSVQANEIVRAESFYTIDDDGLAQKWRGKVWMNPPYASDLVGRFADKLIRHFAAGEVAEAVVLVNNATETQWFQTLSAHASAICFPAKRIRFWTPDGVLGSPLQGQAFLYLGNDPEVFTENFHYFGLVVSVVPFDDAGEHSLP